MERDASFIMDKPIRNIHDVIPNFDTRHRTPNTFDKHSDNINDARTYYTIKSFDQMLLQ